VSVVIKNVGTADATDVNWSIILDGGFILLGKETIGTVNIPAGEEVTVCSDLILGFGRSTITVIASDTEETVNSFVFIVLIWVH
ncbi:unnamed protein product, partial [marine sediment metagenome]